MNSRSKTVLIVDDDSALRDSLADILRDQGYNPITSGTCTEALQIARQSRPGAVLLDLKLPDGAGTTLLADLKKLDPDCICVIVTAYADLDSAVAALEKGAFQYLQKSGIGVEHGNSQTIWLGAFVEIARGKHACRTGFIFYDNVRLARYVFADVFGNQPCVSIEATTRR